MAIRHLTHFYGGSATDFRKLNEQTDQDAST